jgi:hypothetical protein
MASSYPSGLDSFPTNRTDATAMATNHAADHDNNADAINKIEATLGINPQGPFTGVVDRLVAMIGTRRTSTGATALVATDLGKTILISTTVTQALTAAATLGSGDNPDVLG